jgi:hypothetical protein
MSETVRWLMFMYQVPSEPSRLRTAVWRRLKALGAVYAAHSVAVLPESPEAERALRALRAEVGQMGGTAQLVRPEWVNCLCVKATGRQVIAKLHAGLALPHIT